jgi:hypothetical protein
MTGLERNSEVVQMAAYAPLFVHANFVNWPTNLIVIDNHRRDTGLRPPWPDAIRASACVTLPDLIGHKFVMFRLCQCLTEKSAALANLIERIIPGMQICRDALSALMIEGVRHLQHIARSTVLVFCRCDYLTLPCFPQVVWHCVVLRAAAVQSAAGGQVSGHGGHDEGDPAAHRRQRHVR